MLTNQKTLAQDVKREVFAELHRGNTANAPQTGSILSNPRYSRLGESNYTRQAASQTYQTIKDSVKNEIMDEIRMQQADQAAQMYGLGRSLSDRRIQQLIDERYQTIDNMKADLKRELLAQQKSESQRDPQITQIANILSEEARRQGVPLEQIIKGLDQNRTTSTGLVSRIMELLNVGQRRGFLLGACAALMFNSLWPLIRGKMTPVAVRSMEEGMSMVGRAKNYIQEHYPQKPPADPAPEQPLPDNTPPPEGNDTL